MGSDKINRVRLSRYIARVFFIQIDFGFSRIFNPGVPMTAMHGTVYYVSPEVMDGCYQEKCDIWSIGVIVYMLLSGSPPFNGSYDHEILVKIKRGKTGEPIIYYKYCNIPASLEPTD